MKKSKLTATLVSSFIGALALTSCGDTATSSKLTPSDNGTLIELTGYNGETEKLSVLTEEMYQKYTESQDGVKMFYNAVLESLIRYEYPKLAALPGSKLKQFSVLEAEADTKVQSSKETAANSGNYDEEWANILKAHDCETEEDLKQYYLYDLEKTELTDRYFKDNEPDLKDEYIGVDEDWNLVTTQKKDVDSVYPYHIIHVLVKLEAEDTNYNRGTISVANAKALKDVVLKLIDGDYLFENIAKNVSDDTGSKVEYGDVGLMTTKTSFYNEFKLGIYAYDAIMSGINNQDSSNKAIYEAMGLDNAAKVTTLTDDTHIEKELVKDLIQSEMIDRVKTPVSNAAAYTKIPTVPYDVFMKIGDVAEEDKLPDGTSPKAGDVVLPRNVLFNQYLNFHSPFVITAEDLADETADWSDKTPTLRHDFDNGNSYGSGTDPVKTGGLIIHNNNFESDKVAGLGKDVLCHKSGDVIIGVRSQAGIHFMVMRKSVFKATNVAAGKAGQSLQDYYTTDVEAATAATAGETYINMKSNSAESYYKNRAETLKSAFKSTSDFDVAYDYRLYEYLTDNEVVTSIKFFDQDGADSAMKDAINKYIELLREEANDSAHEKINKEGWETYLMKLTTQNNERAMTKSLVPTTCAFKFGDSAYSEEFKEGNKCYVK